MLVAALPLGLPGPQNSCRGWKNWDQESSHHPVWPILWALLKVLLLYYYFLSKMMELEKVQVILFSP